MRLAWDNASSGQIKTSGGDVSSADNSQSNEVDDFLEMVRAVPGPAQRSVDIARQLVLEPTDAVLAALVKDELERQDD